MNAANTPSTIRTKAAQLRAENARRKARRRFFLTSAVVAVVVLVTLGVFVAVHGARRVAVTGGASVPANLGAHDSVVVGSSNAPVTLVAYEDFQCPACRAFEQSNAEQLKQYVAQGTLRIEYRPLAFLDQMSTDRYSTRSLNAAAAVVNSTPGAFAGFHGALFAQQPAEGGPGLTDGQLIEIAVSEGASRAAVTVAVENHTYAGWAASVTENASKANITHTPTIIINGTTLATLDPTVIRRAIETAAR